MIDIVARLRDQQTKHMTPIMGQAADEIERLRTALEFFAVDENWLRDAKLDPNSGNFIGTLYARGALTPGSSRDFAST